MNLNELFLRALTQIPSSTWNILIVMIFLGLLVRIFKTRTMKGKLGETTVRSALFLNLSSEYSVYHNVTLRTTNGTTQIDHVIVSPYGIFCVETKHMKGWIYGSERQKQWTQVIYQKKTRFQNPLRQNYKHTETLRTLLHLPKDKVHSVVAFTGDATLKTDMPSNVGSTKACLTFIKRKQRRVFSTEEVNRIQEVIESGRLEPTRATHRLHVQNLRNQGTDGLYKPLVPDQMDDDAYIPLVPDDEDTYIPLVPDEEDILPTCPKCGAPMKRRTARKGPNSGSKFWGCSTFPKCRYTQPIEKS
jgi:hypothetical protein